MYSGFLTTGTFALTIPLLFLTGGIAIAIVSIIIAGKKKELAHKERLVAIEKGVPLPEEIPKKTRPAYLKNRTAGLVVFFFGIALTIAMWTSGGSVAGVWGLLAIAVGFGYLLASFLEKKEIHEGKEKTPTLQ